jgi:DNA invertase Pin-like site-specific DNA recombinase
VKVAGYVRVSTREQAEHGYGLDVQESAVRMWCKAHGHRLVAMHRDEGISGSNGLESRLGLADALAAVHARKAEGVVVPRLDRLARDLVLQETLLGEARRLGGQVFSCSDAEAEFLVDDPADPSRRLIRQILGAVAEYERSMIALRLRAGRRRKAEQGGYAGDGFPAVRLAGSGRGAGARRGRAAGHPPHPRATRGRALTPIHRRCSPRRRSPVQAWRPLAPADAGEGAGPVSKATTVILSDRRPWP